MKNHITESKQLNGLVPIDLYDPEVVIPSGNLLNPNPFIDEVNKTITLKYSVYDWGSWDSVDVVSEYSTNDRDWNYIGTSQSKSTGTKLGDPSGIIGVEHTLVWQYTEGFHPLSKNVFYPNLKIRLRAEV